jgi:hypothetical protein
LIGKTVNKETIKEQTINDYLEVAYVDITSALLPITEENAFLNKKNIKNFPDSDYFKVKIAASYGHSSFLNMDRNHSSDEEEPLT